jgi:hypothetical protein
MTFYYDVHDHAGYPIRLFNDLFAKYTQPLEGRFVLWLVLARSLQLFKFAVLFWRCSLNHSAVLQQTWLWMPDPCRGLFRAFWLVFQRKTEVDATRGWSRASLATDEPEASGLVHSIRPTWHQWKAHSRHFLRRRVQSMLKSVLVKASLAAWTSRGLEE